MSGEGRKDDAGKPRLDLLPFSALEEVGRVLAFGAEKYGADNWRDVEDGPRRYLAAALRHLFAHARGEVIDEESGCAHLAHAACCVLFVLDEWARPAAGGGTGESPGRAHFGFEANRRLASALHDIEEAQNRLLPSTDEPDATEGK